MRIAIGEELVIWDASALVCLLTESGNAGAWCSSVFEASSVSAPAIAAFETANVLRRQEAARLLQPEAALAAHRNLVALPVDWWDYVPLSDRVWSHRRNLTVSDASYVALAELLDLPLVTLDRKLAHAPGLRCQVLMPTLE